KKGLRVKRIRQIEAIPPTVNTIKENVFRVRLNPHRIQHDTQRYSGPFCNRGPSLLANVFRDLRARRKTFEIGQREFAGAGNESLNGEPPLAKTSSHVLTVLIVIG